MTVNNIECTVADGDGSPAGRAFGACGTSPWCVWRDVTILSHDELPPNIRRNPVTRIPGPGASSGGRGTGSVPAGGRASPGPGTPAQAGIGDAVQRAGGREAAASGALLDGGRGVWQAILPRRSGAACALELVHTYSLIHDDLPAMDNDDLRRGRATCHKAFDEATAILAGDGLLTLAFELIAREVAPASAALRCVRILAEAAGPAGMVGGQMADLQAEQQALDQGNEGSLAELEAIHRRKTGALLRAPLQMGAVIAGAPAVAPGCARSLRAGRGPGLPDRRRSARCPGR